MVFVDRIVDQELKRQMVGESPGPLAIIYRGQTPRSRIGRQNTDLGSWTRVALDTCRPNCPQGFASIENKGVIVALVPVSPQKRCIFAIFENLRLDFFGLLRTI
jgi:hypothetical protein